MSELYSSVSDVSFFAKLANSFWIHEEYFPIFCAIDNVIAKNIQHTFKFNLQY